ncbi:MAG: hypothetical protein LBJ88_01230 [Campylobacteraceae bacterium]|jgi:hypothetical protein|nr:hypothetical protein [Campylobacteraceae bacterium]
MKKIILNPLQGMSIEEIGQINFGESLDKIKLILGNPNNEEEFKLYYDDLELRLDFDKNKLLEFIEIQGPYTQFIEPKIYNINPFKVYADELIDILTKNNNGEIDDFEAPYSYGFSEISVGIWRDLVPKNLEEAANELKNGEYEDSKIWIEEDLKKSQHFWTIGIGNRDYYK